MTNSINPIDEIKNQMAHPYIRERQAALEKIEELLKQNQHVRACVELLRAVIEQNDYLIVSEQAGKILDEWQRQNQIVRTPDDSQHIFGVVCPKCGHQNYYDKRKVCCSSGSIFLGKAEDQRDELLLECQNTDCDNTFVVQVNCEGYQ